MSYFLLGPRIFDSYANVTYTCMVSFLSWLGGGSKKNYHQGPFLRFNEDFERFPRAATLGPHTIIAAGFTYILLT